VGWPTVLGREKGTIMIKIEGSSTVEGTQRIRDMALVCCGLGKGQKVYLQALR